MLKYVGQKKTVYYAPTSDIYNALKHENLSEENYSVPQIYLTKENPFCSTSINILEDVVLQTPVWLIQRNSYFQALWVRV